MLSDPLGVVSSGWMCVCRCLPNPPTPQPLTPAYMHADEYFLQNAPMKKSKILDNLRERNIAIIGFILNERKCVCVCVCARAHRGTSNIHTDICKFCVCGCMCTYVSTMYMHTNRQTYAWVAGTGVVGKDRQTPTETYTCIYAYIQHTCTHAWMLRYIYTDECMGTR